MKSEQLQRYEEYLKNKNQENKFSYWTRDNTYRMLESTPAAAIIGVRKR